MVDTMAISDHNKASVLENFNNENVLFALGSKRSRAQALADNGGIDGASAVTRPKKSALTQ